MWFLTLLFIATTWAAKLDQSYIPPSGAATAGGYPGDISAPFPGSPLQPEVIPIVSYVNQPNNGDGSYSFSYETGNGIKAQEEGAVKNLAPEGEAQVVHGVYAYTGADGVVYTVAYTADENGFVAKGDHLPTAPPIPPEIQAALEQNAAEEATPQAGYLAPTTASPPAQIGYFKYNPAFTNRDYNRHFRRY